MKKFTNLKVKTWELVVVCIILVCVVMRPNWLIQLNQELIGKVLLLVALVVAAYYKPYMGLLVLLLIVSLGFFREGLNECGTNKILNECNKNSACKWDPVSSLCSDLSASRPPETPETQETQ